MLRCRERSAWEPAGTHRARPVTCTWATSVRRCWPGCSPDRPGAGSCSGSRIWTRARVRPGIAAQQLADLAASGSTSTGTGACSRARRPRTRRRWRQLADRTYECFCSRREIAEAASAPHGECRAIPGPAAICPSAERAERRLTRRPALRLRADGARQTVHDLLHGEVTGPVEDFVRAAQRRGRRRTTWRWWWTTRPAGSTRWSAVTTCCPRRSTRPISPTCSAHRAPTYAHVPLAVNVDGSAAGQARRRGDRARAGRARHRPARPCSALIAQLPRAGRPAASRAVTCPLDRFDPAALPREPWVVPANRPMTAKSAHRAVPAPSSRFRLAGD